MADLLIAQGQLDEADKTIGGLERTAERLAPMLAAAGETRAAAHERFSAGQMAGGQAAVSGGDSGAAARGGWSTDGRRRSRPQPAGLAMAGKGLCRDRPVGPGGDGLRAGGRVGAKVGWLRSLAADGLGHGRPAGRGRAYYEQALSLGAPPETWLALAGVRLQRQLRLPKTARNWDPFNKALAEAKKAQEKKPPADPWRLTLLEAEYLVARGEEKGQPAEGSIRDALATVPRRRTGVPRCGRTVVAAGRGLPAARSARRCRPDREATGADQGASRRRPVCCGPGSRPTASRYDEARKALTQGWRRCPKRCVPPCGGNSSRLALREGQPDQAREQLLKLHEKEPDNREWVLRLAELAFESGKLVRGRTVGGRAAQAGGPGRPVLAVLSGPPFVGRGQRARRRQARRGVETPGIHPESASLLAEDATCSKGCCRRPAASSSRRRKPIREAIRLGERLPLVYQRLISLLLQTGRAEEADHYLLLMQDQIAPSETLASLEMVVAARRGQIDRALDAARRGVAAASQGSAGPSLARPNALGRPTRPARRKPR